MGTMLYEILAGRPPFLADSIPSLRLEGTIRALIGEISFDGAGK